MQGFIWTPKVEISGPIMGNQMEKNLENVRKGSSIGCLGPEVCKRWRTSPYNNAETLHPGRSTVNPCPLFGGFGVEGLGFNSGHRMAQ